MIAQPGACHLRRDALRSRAKWTRLIWSMSAEASMQVPACANAIDALSASGIIATRCIADVDA